MTAYYNEIDPFAAQWLRELVTAGHIAPGDVDERSITDVTATDLRGYTQCHFFAGIGVWSYALRLAGWPDDRPVWTGSCPCQPFSTAGKGRGFDDERHLWPHLHRLIAQCRPPVCFGEQVAQKAGAAWFDVVQADLAREDYASGMVVFPACGVGAPHQRQRLYWVAESVADAEGAGIFGVGCVKGSEGGKGRESQQEYDERCNAGRMADHDCQRRQGEQVPVQPWRQEQAGSEVDWGGGVGRPGPTNGFWRDADWLGCRDGKWRAVEPGAFPLAHGAAARVGRLRGFGNAIVAEQARAFIEAYRESVGGGA